MRFFITIFCGAIAILPVPRVVGAQTATPDMILVGGKIVTIDARNTVAQALAIRDGRISAVGNNATIRDLAGPMTQIVELDGRTVIPGLIDSHIHVLRDALSYSTTVDWSGVRDVAAGIALIKEAARKAEPGAFIAVIGGWHKDQLTERRAPTPKELDDAAPNHPVYVQHQFDFAVLNRRAIEALKITPRPAYRRLERLKLMAPSPASSSATPMRER